ncbi:MAG: acyltransferase [Chthoniobacterales bacterium]|nr:acyltransferase [Chthoniobacterales bacterium]
MAESTSFPDPRFATRERQPGLDLLRALAILLVVFYHAGLFGFSLPFHVQRFGWIGVDLFFVLSGYLIAGQLLQGGTGGGSPDLGRFFWRRALRILPAYLVVLAIYFALPLLREYPTIPPLWKFLGFVQNIGLRGGTAFSHAWSLCVEAQFYLLLPFVLTRLSRSRRGAIAPCLVIIGGFLLRGAIAYSLSNNEAVPFRGFQQLIYYATWTRLDPLTLGVTMAAIERYRPSWWSHLQQSARWLWASAVALICYAVYLGERDELTVAVCVFQFPLLALGLSMLLVCAVSRQLPLQRVAVPGAAFVASIAYSVYLSHKMAIHFVAGVCQSRGLRLTSAAAICLSVAAVTLVGVALFCAVERPFLQIRQRRNQQL